mgnify:CR=1 FL=1
MAAQEGVEAKLEWFEEVLDLLSDLLGYLEERHEEEELILGKTEDIMMEISNKYGVEVNDDSLQHIASFISTSCIDDEILKKVFEAVDLEPIYLWDEDEPYVIYIPVEISGEKRYVQVGREGWFIVPPSEYDIEDMDAWFEDRIGTSEPVVRV